MRVFALFLGVVIHLGLYPSVSNKDLKVDKIEVFKSKRKLILYFEGKKVKQYSVSLGENPIGAKQIEGDLKTPEGEYFINGKNPNSKYYKNLGISYPNSKDKTKAKALGKSAGGAIKIHGLPNDKPWLGKLHLLRDWTYGCIAVTNKQMEELYRVINVGTKIVIRP